jgi:hypothetical protein
MASSKTLQRLWLRSPSWLLPLGLLVVAVHANAEWTLVQADAPVTVIHGTGKYRTNGAQRFAIDDMVETSSAGGVQIQDDAGNSTLLGHDTRAMLLRDGQIVLLHGWVKALHACSAPNCSAAFVETTGTRIELDERTAVVVAAAASDYRDANAVFCESGTASMLAIGNPRGKPVLVRLNAQQFAARTAVDPAPSPAPSAAPRPDPAFIAAMPVNFRDAVRPLPIPQAVHDASAHVMQPVSYDDIADWLNSGLAVRTQAATSFATRFQARLSDPAFRREIREHLRALPDWRPLLYPAPRGSASTSAGPYTYRLSTNHP